MNTNWHTIRSAGGKESPQGTELQVKVGRIPGTVDVGIRLPGQATVSKSDAVPIVDGVLELPIYFVFLCHASEDDAIVADVASRLHEDAILTWHDDKDLLPGDEWEREIDKAIESSDYAIVFLSHASVNKTGFFQREVRKVFDQDQMKPPGKRFVIPLLIDDVEPPREFRDKHWVRMDSPDWYEKVLQAIRETNT